LEYALHQMAATKPNTLSASRKPSHFDPDYWMLPWIKRVPALD
jgi:hypothetical protein